MKLCMKAGLGPGYIVLDVDPPIPKGAMPPIFGPWPHVCYGQTAGWIMILLGREVDIGPGDIVLDGDPVPTKGHSPPIFGPYLL